LDVKIKDNKYTEFGNQYIAIAIDTNGIKVTDQGQWMGKR
jgi:hypothetical protein